MRCENCNGCFGGYQAIMECTQIAEWRVTIDPNEIKMEPKNVCNSCLKYIENTMNIRKKLHGRITKIKVEAL